MTLRNMLNDFDVPEWRKERTLHNLQWLEKNLKVRNSGHPNYERVMTAIKGMIKKREYDR